MIHSTRLGMLATVLGSSAFAMTLMACYGCPANHCTSDFDGGDARDDSAIDDAAPDRPIAEASTGDASDAGDTSDAGDASDARDASDGDADGK